MVNRVVKLRIQASKATSGPPLGPVLGQFKIPMMEFCKDFNDKTKIFDDHLYLRVLLFIYDDNTYSYAVKFPSISFFIKSLTELTVLNGFSGHLLLDSTKDSEKLSNSYGILSSMMVYELSRFYKTYNFKDLDDRSIYRIIVSSIKSMGIYVISKNYNV